MWRQRMYYLDSEKSIIEDFQSVEEETICLLNENEEVIQMLESIHNQDKWKLWTESAGKSDPPPDFYSDAYKYMMEVMRVDDHSHKNKKGKIVNPANSHIREIEREILQSGLMESFPNAKLMINASTDLPTDEDHNYEYYYKNFVRVLEHHKERIGLYRRNHPNYKMIFFVMDESSAYIQAKRVNNKHERKVGEIELGQPHFYFADKRFIKAFEDSDIDYLIWYAPFKLINSLIGKLDLPKVCVFDVKKFNFQCKEYIAKCMISAEV